MSERTPAKRGILSSPPSLREGVGILYELSRYCAYCTNTEMFELLLRGKGNERLPYIRSSMPCVALMSLLQHVPLPPATGYTDFYTNRFIFSVLSVRASWRGGNPHVSFTKNTLYTFSNLITKNTLYNEIFVSAYVQNVSRREECFMFLPPPSRCILPVHDCTPHSRSFPGSPRQRAGARQSS